eukprot:3432724-Pyramimonas_sp.AAC.1
MAHRCRTSVAQMSRRRAALVFFVLRRLAAALDGLAGRLPNNTTFQYLIPVKHNEHVSQELIGRLYLPKKLTGLLPDILLWPSDHRSASLAGDLARLEADKGELQASLRRAEAALAAAA